MRQKRVMRHWQIKAHTFLFAALLMFYACSSEQPRIEQTTLNDMISPKMSSYEKETQTFLAQENIVIYFTITQKEYDSLDSKAQEGVSEILSDFYAYAGKAMDTLEKHGIRSVTTVAKTLVLQYPDKTSKEIHVDKRIHFVGLIFSKKDKSPEIHYGISFDSKICEMAARYFGIEIKYP